MDRAALHLSVLCDMRESFESALENQLYNDHANVDSIRDLVACLKDMGYYCDYFGGVFELIRTINSGRIFKDHLFVNFSDGLKQDYSRVQTPLLLDILGVPYTGSGVFSCALLNNKHCANLIARKKGFVAPTSLRASASDYPPSEDVKKLLPVFIKPNTEGSSLGIDHKSYQDSLDGALQQINSVISEYGEAVVETYVPGDDVTVVVIGNPIEFKCVEAIHLSTKECDYLSVEAKSNHLLNRTLCENSLGKTVSCLVCQQAKQLFVLFDCHDLARFDFRIAKDGTPFFIEGNSFPRISRTSEIGFIAQERNRSFGAYVQDYIEGAIERLNQS